MRNHPRLSGSAICSLCLLLLGPSSVTAGDAHTPSRQTPTKRASSPTEAEPPIDRVAANAAFHEGLRAFNLGQWEQAVAGFEKSYKLSGDPALLFNVAQAQRQAGHRKEALIAYKAYLRENPDTPHRALVEAKVRELEVSTGPAKAAAPVKPGVERPPEVWVNPFEPAGPAVAPQEAATEPVAVPSAEPAEAAVPEPARAEEAPLLVGAPPATVPSPGVRVAPPTEAQPAPAAQTGSSSNQWWLWTGIRRRGRGERRDRGDPLDPGYRARRVLPGRS